ncbi:hypothetical protein [Lysinibacillus contaminans]|uniref:hypothetical protein n=1 Tax=Lysinibacillus contaminans TaxID=1293441 RepID=UPI0012E2929A|nr:hypothetical protein [Lysinibacillus contaminans]
MLQMGGFSYGPTSTIDDAVTGDNTDHIDDGNPYWLIGSIIILSALLGILMWKRKK